MLELARMHLTIASQQGPKPDWLAKTTSVHRHGTRRHHHTITQNDQKRSPPLPRVSPHRPAPFNNTKDSTRSQGAADSQRSRLNAPGAGQQEGRPGSYVLTPRH